MTGAERLLDLDTRRRVYKYVESHPGMHLRGIHRGLDIPLGTVEYHLHQMEKSGLMVSRDDGRFKAFFIKEGLDRRDKDILYYVRQENPRRIVIHLLENPGDNHTNIVGVLPVGPSTVSFHLNKLVTAGLVQAEKQGRTKAFYVNEPQRVADVLVRYRKSFLDDLVDRFAGSWLGMQAAENATIDDDGDDGGEGTGGTKATTKESTSGPEAPAPKQDDTQRLSLRSLITALLQQVRACKRVVALRA
jgi:DNA-binding transcriptional ArsR family regulator